MSVRLFRSFFDNVVGRKPRELSPSAIQARKQMLESMNQRNADVIAEQVLANTSKRGGLINAARAMAIPTTEDIAMGVLAGGSVGAGAYMLQDVPPEKLGEIGAAIGLTYQELMQKIKNTAQDVTAVPQAYFMRVQEGYNEAMDKTMQEANLSPIIDQKIEGDQIIRTHQDGSTSVAPRFEGIDEGIKPVSLMFAEGGLASMYSDPRTEGFIDRLKRFPDYQPTTKLTTNIGALPDDPKRLSTKINAFPRLQKFFGYVPDRFQVINFLVGEYPETFGQQEGYLLMETMSDAKLENMAADALQKKSQQTGGMALSLDPKEILEKPNNRFSELDYKILMDTGQGYAGIARDMGLEGVDKLLNELTPPKKEVSDADLIEMSDPMNLGPDNQIFSLQARIENLKKSYDMLVRNNEFDRAQQVANDINNLDVEISRIKAGMNNQMQDTESISGMLQAIR
tara:strand:+ start:49 stop:1410 length:1362 start_codon:yes stop_codon:yes gene_type:complete